jgi:hypothetical protein
VTINHGKSVTQNDQEKRNQVTSKWNLIIRHSSLAVQTYGGLSGLQNVVLARV